MKITFTNPAHVKAQAARLFRIIAAGLVSSGVAAMVVNSAAVRGLVGSAGVGALEVLWRQIRPAIPMPAPKPPA